MNGPWFAEQLAAAGLDTLEVQAKAILFDRVLRAFREISPDSPDLVSWVPGRLEVFGTHTDYAGGQTLVSALPRGFAFAAKLRTDRKLQVLDASTRESLTIDTGEPMRGVTGWRHYVEVVLDRLSRNFQGAPLGADIVFASDLPRAAGMSSSSALIVGVASTLTRLSGIRDRDEWRRDVPGPLQEAGYYACIENGRSFGALSGHDGVGTHGGSEDHAAMLCATAGSLTSFAFVPMREIGTVRVPDNWRVVVASSGVAAEKTGAALGLYNRLAHGASALLDLWNAFETPAHSLAAALSSAPDASARLQRYIDGSQIADWPPDALSSRLQHFVHEDTRVRLALLAFRNEDVTGLGELASASQRDAETLLGNQVTQTVALTQLALDAGAFAARSFGAGFGGSVWALVTRDRSSAFADDWLNSYVGNFSGTRRPVAFLASPAPSLVEFSYS